MKGEANLSKIDLTPNFVVEIRNPGDREHGRFAAQFPTLDRAFKFFNTAKNMGVERRLFALIKEEIDE